MKIPALLALGTLALTVPLIAGRGMAHRRMVRHRMLRAFVEADANGDRQLSKSEVAGHARLAGRFDEIDADRNGQLTLAEIRAAREARREKLRAADADHDRRISRAEAENLPQLAEHFDELDIDQDGFVTRGEVKAARVLMREKLRLADRNDDHALSREEVKDIPRLKDNFTAIDADRDGKLTRQEMKAWRMKSGAAPAEKK